MCRWAAARPLAVRAASFARRVVSKPGQAPPPPPSIAARPTNPSGALHTGGAWSTINFACNSPTTLSNHGFRLLELQRFQTLLKLLPIELHATFLGPGPAETFGLRGLALCLEVCLVSPVSAAPGVLRGVYERNIAPAR